MCRMDWSPLLELYELTAEVKDENGRTLMRGLSAKVPSLLWPPLQVAVRCVPLPSLVVPQHRPLSVAAMRCAYYLVLMHTAARPNL